MVEVLARAKINLTLDILGLRPDSFHQVETVMQSIALHDTLEIDSVGDDIELVVPGGEVAAGKDNLVYRAAELLRERLGRSAGARIVLNKQIPLEAGLGGGSADAAAAMLALNDLWGLRLPLTELITLGQRLGSDIPFCMLEGAALAGGRGELLQPLPACPAMGVVVVKPPWGASTAAVYRAYDAMCPGDGPVQEEGFFSPAPDAGFFGFSKAATSDAKGAYLSTQLSGARKLTQLKAKKTSPDTIGMIKAIEKQSPVDIAAKLANVLEAPVLTMHPAMAGIKERLLQAGAMGVLMSGSGSAVFGLTCTIADADSVAERFRCAESERVFITETWNRAR